MPTVTGHRASEAETGVIEIRLTHLNQLFNTFDPSPFHERDLDQDAEDYIVASADEYSLKRPLRLVILPADEVPPPGEHGLPHAIHNYFAYQMDVARRRLRFQLREGRVALVIGLAFLLTCLSLRQVALSLEPGPTGQILREGLLIVGWVAMWRPLEIFLYDWWPIRHADRLFKKLSAIPVLVREPSGHSARSHFAQPQPSAAPAAG
jgi:hypothetical protein